MKTTLKALASALLLLVLAFAVGACGDDEDDAAGGSGGGDAPAQTQTTSGGGGKLIERDAANSGKRITVGSKNFAEQYILGEIYAQALQAAGFTVKKQLDLGSEQVAFRALKRGTIDAYPEYTGTALTSFYKVEVDDVPRDKEQSFAQLKADLAKDGITAMPQTPFQNTYVVTSTKAVADELGNPKTITELAEKAGSSKRLSGFPECRQRTDCLLGLKQRYGWSPKFVSSTGQYSDLDKGQADFTMGFGTDGPLSLDKYVTYEDDKQLFPPYYVTFMVRQSGVEKLGAGGQAVIEKVQEPLTEEVMQELNSRVTIDKQKPEAVAAAYLREAGFVEG
ncbi:glycine betaine ABC transporter substrate-binding protein [Conexibacter sp. SYSU D00693]|uniref:ABC transporter substrate-binding protein n=1 Tax=Conexibacter sp. SYSU D00693 TaxID=2812560 RepID=UPI00196B2861|nr:glycine betaine ABC transporter substrate-binding protein [Conexibacter sp. SYSU D00693]